MQLWLAGWYSQADVDLAHLRGCCKHTLTGRQHVLACRDNHGAPTLSEASHGGSGSTNTADPESSFTSRTQAVLSHLQVLHLPTMAGSKQLSARTILFLYLLLKVKLCLLY